MKPNSQVTSAIIIKTEDLVPGARRGMAREESKKQIPQIDIDLLGSNSKRKSLL